MFPKKMLLMLLVSGFLATLGQAAEGDELLEMSLDELLNVEVTTATKKAEKSDSAPATVYVVTADTIAARGYRNLKELLEDIPEIEIQSNAVAEFNNYFSIRGIAGNERFIVLLNGFRFNSPTGSPHVIEHNYPLVNVAQVEIILGPASALYGADAFGGIVNIITRDGEQGKGGVMDVAFGRFATQETALTYGHTFDRLRVSASAFRYESDEAVMPDFYPEEYAWYRNNYQQQGTALISPFIPVEIEIDPSLQNRPYETPNKAEFINLLVGTDQFQLGYSTNSERHSSSTGMRPEFNLFVGEALYRTDLESMFAKYQYKSSNERWFLDSSVWKGTYEIAPESAFLNTFTFYRPGYKYADAQTVKFEEQLTVDMGKRGTLIAGLSYEDVSALPKTGDLPAPFDPDLPADSQDLFYIGTDTTDAAGNDLTVEQAFFPVDYQNLAAYLQVSFSMRDTLDVTLGARFDDSTRYGSTFNPRLGLVKRFSPRLTFKFLYGTAFLAPSPYLALQHYGSFIPVDAEGNAAAGPEDTAGLFGPFWHLPNPDLAPEELTSFETSLAYYANDHWGLFINAYHNNVTDRVVNSGQFGRTFAGIPVGFAEVPINGGESDAYGGTLRLNYLGSLGSLQVNAFAAWSYADGEVDEGPLTYTAENTFRLVAELRAGKLTASPRLLVRGKSRHFLLDENGRNFENEAYEVVNLFARYRSLVKQGRWEIDTYLRVTNLFDERYTNVPLAQFEGFTATPQDPRFFSGGFTVKF
ncbi:TonB-dependent receptor plug domain-containing protein [Acanthopleuribacter pedis]|uniref:TonB-dependent receptor n=1 Tax=Acanthopleuribacter pedis TaxID=442870 RepID=A0A8J7U333_9BACT|nr:TonB-dependent receptor [Acanthopleuribacter pedis]MBO1319953.1 TonB-dependent receptor [Acanthopleuribacter pedis]